MSETALSQSSEASVCLCLNTITIQFKNIKDTFKYLLVMTLILKDYSYRRNREMLGSAVRVRAVPMFCRGALRKR